MQSLNVFCTNGQRSGRSLVLAPVLPDRQSHHQRQAQFAGFFHHLHQHGGSRRDSNAKVLYQQIDRSIQDFAEHQSEKQGRYRASKWVAMQQALP